MEDTTIQVQVDSNHPSVNGSSCSSLARVLSWSGCYETSSSTRRVTSDQRSMQIYVCMYIVTLYTGFFSIKSITVFGRQPHRDLLYVRSKGCLKYRSSDTGEYRASKERNLDSERTNE